MNVPPTHSPRQNVAISDTQLNMLRQWAEGDFDADYDPAQKPPRTIEDVPLAQQPEVLDRASLDFCLADAFHPGCEMTWPMRQPSMYMSAFRVLHAVPGWVEPTYGPQLSLDMIPPPANDPFMGQIAGGLTRWMALPWQTDTASCRYNYGNKYDPNLPTFWPARVPNTVLDDDDYNKVINRSLPLDERLAAFARRIPWTWPLGKNKNTTYFDQINNMIAHFGDLGVVELREGPGDAEFPATMQVQNLQATTRQQLVAQKVRVTAADEVDLSGIEKVRRFPRGLK